MVLIETQNGIETIIAGVNLETKQWQRQKEFDQKNFSEYEIWIVSDHPVIGSKTHTTATEQKKKSGWASVCNKFTANGKCNHGNSTTIQVKYLHYYQYFVCLILIFLWHHFNWIISAFIDSEDELNTDFKRRECRDQKRVIYTGGGCLE